MQLFFVLKTLWRLLPDRRRVRLGLLLPLMIISALSEMTGMIFIFGYIGGLSGNSDGRSGMLLKFYETTFGPSTQSEFALFGGIMVVGVFLFKNLLTTGINLVTTRFLAKTQESVSRQLLTTYLNSAYVNIQRVRNESKQNVSSLRQLFHNSFSLAVLSLADLISILFISALLFIIHAPLATGALLIFALPLLILSQATRGSMRRLAQHETANREAQQTILGDAFGGLLEVQLTKSQASFVNRFDQANGQASWSERRINALGNLPRLASETLLATGIVLAALYLLHSEGGLHNALAILALFGLAGMRLAGVASRVTRRLQQLSRKHGEFRELVTVLESVTPHLLERERALHSTISATTEPAKAPTRQSLRQAICLADVKLPWLEDDSGAALRDISLTIPKGHCVAFHGGAQGARAALQLALLGALPPSEGRISCDDWDIYDDPDAWRHLIGYLGRKPFVPQVSVLENVTLGQAESEIDIERVWHCLEQAGLAKQIRALPDGLQTQLLDEPAHQALRQGRKLALARILYKDPDIWLFEETSDNPDDLDEQHLRHFVSGLEGSKTLIWFARRALDLDHCDTIYVITDDRIAVSQDVGDWKRNGVKARQTTKAANQSTDTPSDRPSKIPPA